MNSSRTSNLLPAVVVSGYTMGLGVIRSLGTRGVKVVVAQYHASDIGQHSRYVAETVRVADPNRHEDAFVQDLMALGESIGEAVLFPASDAALAAISRARDQLATRFRVACVDWDRARLFVEKKHTYQLAESAGVAVPKTITPLSESEVAEYASAAAFPILVKPSQSHLFVAEFGTKMFAVDDVAGLLAAYRRSSAAGLEVMLQEIIPGPAGAGVNYNSYVVDGRPVAEFTARKVRNAPHRFGSPCVAMTEHIPEVLASGRRAIQALGFEGFSCAEFKHDHRDGKYKLMEVNGRHNLSSLLAVKTGIDFPWMEYSHLTTGTAPEAEDFVDGVYWIDFVRDVGATLRAGRGERSGIRDLIRPYIGPNVFAVWDWKDPKPMIYRLWDTIRRLVA